MCFHGIVVASACSSFDELLARSHTDWLARSVAQVRDGTGRKAAVEHGWMQREVDSDEEDE